MYTFYSFRRVYSLQFVQLYKGVQCTVCLVISGCSLYSVYCSTQIYSRERRGNVLWSDYLIMVLSYGADTVTKAGSERHAHKVTNFSVGFVVLNLGP